MWFLFRILANFGLSNFEVIKKNIAKKEQLSGSKVEFV